MFNAIEDLLELTLIADMPMSESQAINLAYVVFVRSPVLHKDILAWIASPL